MIDDAALNDYPIRFERVSTEVLSETFDVNSNKSRSGNCKHDIETQLAPRPPQYTRFFGLMYSMSSVSVYSWTGR